MLMLTYGGLKQHIILALGGQPSIVSGVSREQRIAEIANQAGQYMFSKQWRFRERTARPVSLTAGQDWAPLPDNVEEIVSLVCKGGLGWRVELTSPEHMELMRTSVEMSFTDSTYYAALSRPWAQSNGSPLVAGTGMPAVRLELYPEPSVTTNDALIIRYRAAWEPLSGEANAVTPDTYQIAVPPYAESLLIAYCRAFAVAYEDEGLTARLLEIDNGPVANACAIKDGIQQRDLGRLPAARGPMVRDPLHYRRGFVSDPS